MSTSRTILQEATYHCYSICHDEKNLLQAQISKQFFIEAVQMCLKKYKFELSSLEIVDNCIHLVIKTLKDGATISRIMQYIKSRTAEKCNKTMNRSGAFWSGRFNCKIVK